MKIRLLLILLGVLIAGCDKANDFEMMVDQVDEMKGFILKGISISGKIKNGCIANDDVFIVQREGKQVLEDVTRVLNVEGLKDADSFAGEVFEGDYVTFYIPDGSRQDVHPGDIIISNTTSCRK